jgi:4-phosphopantoate--beta-alanine ligase
MSTPQASSGVPLSHPRYHSLMARERIVHGVECGITSPHGLIAHGRGEAFDYLLGERTHAFATAAIEAAAAMLLTAEWPVISVNGNACALAAEDLVALAQATGARLEVNIFHTSAEREQAIRGALIAAGAEEVLLPSRTHALEHIEHNRRWIHPDGIFRSDVVFVPLEDGDRCEALVRNGRKVITVDLNPLSRTARMATVTVVDNLTRCLPLLVQRSAALCEVPRAALADFAAAWNNQTALTAAEEAMRRGS